MAAMTEKSETTQRMLERPAIQCSQGGVPFNDFHLKEKDAIIATLRIKLAAVQASERERAAKVCGDIAAKLALRAATAADGEWACVFGYQEVAVEECEAAIRALSPTQETA